MTVSTEITRLKTSIANAYDALEAKGATMPTIENPDNLADAIESITGGGEQIEATNNTGSNISEGDKVWIEPSGSNYNLINLRYTYNNFTVIGSPTVNTSTGVVSGFSSSSYLTLPQSFNPGNNTWEVKLKITTSYDVSSVQGVFQTITAYSENGQYGIIFLIYDGKSHFAVSTDGSSFMFNKSGSLNLSTNTTYWIKFGWTGTEYYLDYSTDGTNYTRDITENSTTPAFSLSNYTLLGIYSWKVMDNYFRGTLDLSECYININNLIWWNPKVIQISEDAFSGFAKENITSGSKGLVNIGTVIDQNAITATNDTGSAILEGDKVWINQEDGENKLVNYYNSIPNLDIVGSPTISSDCIVNKFSQTNYLKSQNTFNPGNNSWEISLKFITSNNISTEQNLFQLNKTSSSDIGIDIGIFNNGKFEWGFSFDGSSWSQNIDGTHNVLPNTIYYLKLGWDCEKYYLDYKKENDTQYTRDIEYISSIPVFAPLTYKYIGAYFNGYTMIQPFLGSVDLKETYIKINDEKIWEGYKEQIIAPISAQTGTAAESISIGATGLVNVGAVIKPTGSITITENGTHNVTNYAEAIVNITSGGDIITATNNTGAAVNVGDKVWIEPFDNNYNLINFRSAYSNFTVVGSMTVNTSTGVATGFSLNNYLQLPEPFNPGNQPWEVQVKFSSNDVSQSLALFHSMTYKSGGIYGIVFDIEDNKFVFGISNNGSSWLFAQSGTYTPQSNTVYWVKFGWTGTEYYLDYSTDGTNYTRDITITSSTPAHQNNTVTEFGLFSWNSWEGRYLNGPLYLEDCYIKINGLEWWNPRVISITENTLTGYAQETIANGATGFVNVASEVL